MKRSLLLTTTLLLLCFVSVFLYAEDNSNYIANQLKEIDQVNAQGPWKANWDSLTKHKIPEWFQDAKFGIYGHLGVYCVPAFGSEWYPRLMYQKNDRVYKHHIATYGDPSVFGYKDFIPKFKLEKFDPAAWAQLYKDAGVRFAGPVAEHHDGFSMWASKVNRWNAASMGPKQDVAGELIQELKKRDIHIITSFHHAFNIQGYYSAEDPNWDTADPQYGDLYGFPTMKDRTLPLQRWIIKIKEVIDNYQPDQIWFDFGLGKIPDELKQKMAAYYYNKAAQWGKEVIITRKDNYLPEGVAALDIERGRMKDAAKETWQTDDATAYNSWCWVQGLKVKPPVEMVHELIDIVSKNGVLLLNICPKADGTISDDQQVMLKEIGKWLKTNGEAIYATRPWKVFGEGPTRMEKGGAFLDTIHYTPQDIRYTRSKDGSTLYAIALGWPQNKLDLRYVQVAKTNPNAKVSLLGSDQSISYHTADDGHLVLDIPSLSENQRPSRYAYTFKLQGFHPQLSDNARFSQSNAIELKADKAVFEGSQIKTETRAGRTNIGFWDKSDESVHWLAYIREPGTYDIIGEFATTNSEIPLTLDVAERSVDFTIKNTGSWDSPKIVGIGQINFDKAGVYHLTLKPTKGKPWKAVNVWRLALAPAR